jgi:phosphoserine phosphatase RsbU/P
MSRGRDAPTLEDLRSEDLELFYDRAPCGYLSTTPDGLVVNVNQTFLEWTGYRRAELVGERRFVDLLSVGGRIYLETHFLPMLLMQGHVREIALEVLRADGGRLPVLVNASLDRDDEGRPTVVRVALLDSTERREYERELVRAKERAEESEARARTLARTLQEAFIPPVPPRVPGLDVAGVYRPAGVGDEVGGDFYDVFQVSDDEWAVALGDVCGKGVAAAVVTTLVRYTIRAVTVRTASSAEALGELNAVLLDQGLDRFCTVALVRLRPEGTRWQVDLALGGHPQPVLCRPGAEPDLFGEPGSLIGLMDDPDLHTSHLGVGPGSTLLLYTDGVTEGRDGDCFFGEEPLLEAVDRMREESAEDLVESVLADVLAFQHGEARDDIALVALRVPPGGR